MLSQGIDNDEDFDTFAGRSNLPQDSHNNNNNFRSNNTRRSSSNNIEGSKSTTNPTSGGKRSTNDIVLISRALWELKREQVRPSNTLNAADVNHRPEMNDANSKVVRLRENQTALAVTDNATLPQWLRHNLSRTFFYGEAFPKG